MLRLDAYIRVSKVGARSGDSFISPEVQREQVRAAVDLIGGKIVFEHVDLDESGAKRDRPGWQAALARVESGATDGIVVAKLDRFARSTLDAVEALRRIEAAGGHFISAAERFDTTTPFGKFAQTVMFALAELEHARIRDTWAISASKAIGRGVHTTIPYGYKRGAGKRLVLDEAEAAAVQSIYAARVAGQSWAAIVDELNAAGIAPRAAAAWSRPAVRRIVSNRAYLGEAFYGEHREQGAHEALVDEATWHGAQPRQGQVPQRRDDGGPLLAGLVRCAGCSYMMSGGTSQGWRVYRCNVRHGGGSCPGGATITEHLLDGYVEEVFLEQASGIEVLAVPESSALDLAHTEVSRATRELVAWRDDLRIREVVGHEHYLAGLSARASDLERAQDELRQATSDNMAAQVVHDSALWPTLSMPERRIVLAAGIDAVFVRRGRRDVAGRTRILWRGEAKDLPRRGVASTPTPFTW